MSEINDAKEFLNKSLQWGAGLAMAGTLVTCGPFVFKQLQINSAVKDESLSFYCHDKKDSASILHSILLPSSDINSVEVRCQPAEKWIGVHGKSVTESQRFPCDRSSAMYVNCPEGMELNYERRDRSPDGKDFQTTPSEIVESTLVSAICAGKNSIPTAPQISCISLIGVHISCEASDFSMTALSFDKKEDDTYDVECIDSDASISATLLREDGSTYETACDPRFRKTFKLSCPPEEQLLGLSYTLGTLGESIERGSQYPWIDANIINRSPFYILAGCLPKDRFKPPTLPSMLCGAPPQPLIDPAQAPSDSKSQNIPQ